MASGYTVSGRGDLDSLFMARVNAARAAVGYQVGGSDIANRYEPIGAGTPIAPTGFKTTGTDLNLLFRNISESLATVSISDMTCNNGGAGSRGCTYSLWSDGDIQAMNNTTGTVDRGDWVTPTGAGVGAAYSAYCTLVSSHPSFVGPVATWVNLGTTRQWSVTQNTIGTARADFDLQIRRDSDGVVLDTARIVIIAQRTS